MITVKKLDLAVVILTYNEEIHIERCIKNILPFVKEVFVVDSFSSDRTCDLASSLGAKILQNKWVNYATQFNWGLENAPITATWILRLDADEYLSEELIKHLQDKLEYLPDNISAISIRLKHKFLGKFIRGGTGVKHLVRLFRRGRAKSEVRQMDEHIQVEGGVILTWEESFYDDNLNNLTWWIQKHNGYSIREAADLLDLEYNISGKIIDCQIEGQAKRIRKNKNKYASMPLFWRAFAYFLYRYFLKGGFLEGKEGFLWCFLQGWWYRTLVDAKIFEIKRICKNDPSKIKSYFEKEYNIKF